MSEALRKEGGANDAFVSNVRSRVLAAIAEDKISRRQFADEIGQPEGTIGPWLNDKYAGDQAKLAHYAEKWLQARADKATRYHARVEVPPFQMTPTAEHILGVLDHALFDGKMVIVALKPGSGKTEACRYQAQKRNRVYLAVMRPTTSKVGGALQELLAAMGEPDTRGTPAAMARRIATKVREPGALLIIDEAQTLSVNAIEELRAIHDETRCGLALVGDERLLATFDASQYSQLRRRIGRRCPPVRNLDKDAEVLARAWGVTDAGEIKFLQAVARKPGALGGVGNVMEMATKLAGLEERPRDIGCMRAAWSELMPEVPL